MNPVKAGVYSRGAGSGGRRACLVDKPLATRGGLRRPPPRNRRKLRSPMYYNPFVWLLLKIIDIYFWVVIAAVIMSWLTAFGVVNVYNQIARSIMRVLDALTEPVFRQVRRVIPAVAGLDFSPLIVLLGLQFLSFLIVYYL
jgi:YggT family protein